MRIYRTIISRVILLLVYTLLYFIPGSLLAQGNDKTDLKEALKKLELSYNIRIFYLPEMVDTIQVSSTTITRSLENDLENILKGTYLEYLRYSDRNLVILKGDRYQQIEYEQSLPEYRMYDQNIKYMLSGQVLSMADEEPQIGATVYVEELDTGTITNLEGKFDILLSSGKYHIKVNSVGNIEEVSSIELTEDRFVTFELSNKVVELSEVIIRDKPADVNVSDVSVGVTRLNIKTIKTLPAFMGETDVIRSLLMLPGVSSVGEASTGVNIRGGSADQNLFLYDDAPIFNTSHLFGLFSAFNQDMVNEVTLMRAGIPAKYGGRLSSVIDVKSKESLVDRFSIKGGIGLISSRLAVEMPVWKDKISILAGGRTSYSDFMLNYFPDKDIRNSSAFFYDANVKINSKIDLKNTLQISYYSSYDNFIFPSDTAFGWGTQNASARWNHLFGDDLLANIVIAYSNYDYGINNNRPPKNFSWEAGIDYLNMKTDMIYLGLDKHRLEFGGGVIWYDLQQGNLYAGTDSEINEFILENERSREYAVYVNDEFEISEKLKLMYGLRTSMYEFIGPKTINYYANGLPKDEFTITGSDFFASGEVIDRYYALEPRISLRYGLTANSSLKFSYNRMAQYLHLISNTTSITPVDIWKSSDPYIKPQLGDQYAVGYFRNYLNNTLEASAEIYYKDLKNMADYKDGARLFLNPVLESEILQGEGRAYGIELMMRKSIGWLTGWISYAYSRSERKVLGPTPEETINSGNYYPANFDKPHDLKLSSILKLSRRWSISGNFVFSTGRPATYPTGKYIINKLTIADYNARNQYRIPDYHRLDLAITFEGSNKRNKRWLSSWTFSVYNVYSRENAYSVFFQPKEGSRLPQAYKLAILGAAFPALTYNFNFH